MTRTSPDDAPADLLRQACTLVRLCGQDGLIAAVLLVVVGVGVIAQLAVVRPGIVQLVPLAALAIAYAGSAGFLVRSRMTLVAALSTARGNTGSPLDPGVPWRPFALDAALDARVRDGELRRLLAAAHRCSELSWRAVVWGMVTALAFVIWTMAMVTL
ncbi:hypothetical protein ACGFNU_18570 [Spirillospora sp. NPDC048911]|uniref:hypothetical protein n=1 Tax=Spirillospora sp. NPDC048911 TaxID=3364527 RepID=UPI00371FB27D